jgi:hypothetical protein
MKWGPRDNFRMLKGGDEVNPNVAPIPQFMLDDGLIAEVDKVAGKPWVDAEPPAAAEAPAPAKEEPQVDDVTVEETLRQLPPDADVTVEVPKDTKGPDATDEPAPTAAEADREQGPKSSKKKQRKRGKSWRRG